MNEYPIKEILAMMILNNIQTHVLCNINIHVGYCRNRYFVKDLP